MFGLYGQVYHLFVNRMIYGIQKFSLQRICYMLVHMCCVLYVVCCMLCAVCCVLCGMWYVLCGCWNDIVCRNCAYFEIFLLFQYLFIRGIPTCHTKTNNIPIRYRYIFNLSATEALLFSFNRRKTYHCYSK